MNGGEMQAGKFRRQVSAARVYADSRCVGLPVLVYFLRFHLAGVA